MSSPSELKVSIAGSDYLSIMKKLGLAPFDRDARDPQSLRLHKQRGRWVLHYPGNRQGLEAFNLPVDPENEPEGPCAEYVVPLRNVKQAAHQCLERQKRDALNVCLTHGE